MLPGIPQPVHSPGIHNVQLEQQKVGIESCIDFYWEISSCLVKKSELQLFPPHLGSLVLLTAVCEVPGKFWMLLRLVFMFARRVFDTSTEGASKGSESISIPSLNLPGFSVQWSLCSLLASVFESDGCYREYFPGFDLICCSVLQTPQHPWNIPKTSWALVVFVFMDTCLLPALVFDISADLLFLFTTCPPHQVIEEGREWDLPLSEGDHPSRWNFRHHVAVTFTSPKSAW